jgi:phospholipase/carboxylesterase
MIRTKERTERTHVNRQTFNGELLPYILLQPEDYKPGDEYPLVVLLHGLGASMYDLAGLAPAIDGEGYLYAFPNAPYRMDIGGGQVGYSWRAGVSGAEALPEGSASVEELLDVFFHEIEEQTGVPASRTVLGGFSQGGGLTLRYALPRAESFAGLIVLSGAFRDGDELRPRIVADRSLPIFIAHGRYDPVVVPSTGRATKAFLDELGFNPTFNEYDMAHQVSVGVIRDLTPWLHATLPPKRKSEPAR